MSEPAVITAPSKEPISLVEAKLACGIVTSDYDAWLNIYIPAARRYYEWRTERTIHQTTLEWILDAFPSGVSIVLPRATPLIATPISIKYKDSAGAETTLAAAEYIADVDSLPGKVTLAYNKSWPSFTPYPVAPIRIRYLAGLATTSPVSECDPDVKLAISLLVNAMYENREAVAVTDRGSLSQLSIRYGLEDLIAKRQVTYEF